MGRIDHTAAVGNDALAGRAERTGADLLRDLAELTKPRITKLVVVTTGVGFVMAALGGAWTAWTLVLTGVFCLLGTALSASGANALNQWWERRRDALMPRTLDRPVPSGRVTATTALWFGAACSASGVLILWAMTTSAAAVISLSTILIYVFVYTPLKPVTTLSTMIGAVPGALPPVIGWAAAGAWNDTGWTMISLAGGWVIFAIMFIWQIPHFLSIAWMHRDGYAKGGYRMLPLFDPDGTRTTRATLAWIAALVPVSLTPALVMPELIGWLYVASAVALGIVFLAQAIRFASRRDDASARRVFFASIIYLPLLLLAMVADALTRSLLL